MVLRSTSEILVTAFAREDGSVAPTHVIQVRNEEAGAWFEAYVCAHAGEILSVTDFVAHASVSRIRTCGSQFSNQFLLSIPLCPSPSKLSPKAKGH
jgi:hypothetical protein